MNANLAVSLEVTTMADLIEAISRDDALSPTRRRNLTSSIRVMARALGMTPEMLPASFEALRERLSRFHPLSAGIRDKRWQNIRADVSFALKRFSTDPVVCHARAALTADWKHVREVLRSSGSSGWKLSRLAGFCSGRGVPPGAVNDAIMSEYGEMVRKSTLKTKPERHLREVCLHWNRAAESRPQLGLHVVAMPSARKRLTPDWADLHPKLRDEAEAWLLHLSTEGDILDETAPSRPLRPASVRSYRYSLRQAVAGHVASGCPLSEIRSLSQLVEGDTPRHILRQHLDRMNGETSSMIAGISNVLVRIAETRADLGEDAIQRLRNLRSRVTPWRRGMSQRPKEALRPFANRDNIEKLLILPVRIFKRFRSLKDPSPRDLLDMQAAVALELLLMRPIRRNNLVQLKLGTNLHFNGPALCITVPGDEVKNGDDLDYPVPAETARLIRFYIDRILPLLGSNPDGWLFPGQGRIGHKAPETLARNFKDTIRRWTGLDIYPHLMRHFGASLHLEHHPGAFETVRRVLGHRSLDTTVRSYAQMQDSVAVRQFDQLVLNIRRRITEGSKND